MSLLLQETQQFPSEKAELPNPPKLKLLVTTPGIAGVPLGAAPRPGGRLLPRIARPGARTPRGKFPLSPHTGGARSAWVRACPRARVGEGGFGTRPRACKARPPPIQPHTRAGVRTRGHTRVHTPPRALAWGSALPLPPVHAHPFHEPLA